MEDLCHQLIMVDLRVRFGITEEKSAMEASGRMGLKFKACKSLFVFWVFGDLFKWV